MSKQVQVVQRMLLPHRSGQPYDVVHVKDLQNKLVNRQESPSLANGNSSQMTSFSDASSSKPTQQIDEEKKILVETLEINEQSNSITPDSGMESSCHSSMSTNDQSSNDSTAFLSEQPSESMEFDECSSKFFSLRQHNPFVF